MTSPPRPPSPHGEGGVESESSEIFFPMKDKYTDSLHGDAFDKLYKYARVLRERSTEAEEILWKHLRGRKLDGYKFRRQHPLDIYVADFYCHQLKLVLELDGSVHEGRMNENYDEVRTERISESGITVIRFKNDEVVKNINYVLGEIRRKIKDITSAG